MTIEFYVNRAMKVTKGIDILKGKGSSLKKDEKLMVSN
jgi:hypothetical protein